MKGSLEASAKGPFVEWSRRSIKGSLSVLSGIWKGSTGFLFLKGLL